MALPAVTGQPIEAADINAKAPLASPTFTGTVTLPATVVVPDGTLAIADTSGLQSALDGKVASSLVDAAGDLLVGTADNTVGRLAKGTALQTLRVNSGATALEWATSSTTALNTQTGTTYTLVLADGATPTTVEMNNASANTLTVPPNSSVAIPIGTVIGLRQYGAGQTTIAPGAGVTIRSRGPALKLHSQYAEATLIKRATDEWVLSGDLTA